MKVNSESGFGCKTFQLTALSLAVVKLVSVPGGRMGEGDQWISTCAGVESRRALLLWEIGVFWMSPASNLHDADSSKALVDIFFRMVQFDKYCGPVLSQLDIG